MAVISEKVNWDERKDNFWVPWNRSKAIRNRIFVPPQPRLLISIWSNWAKEIFCQLNSLHGCGCMLYLIFAREWSTVGFGQPDFWISPKNLITVDLEFILVRKFCIFTFQVSLESCPRKQFSATSSSHSGYRRYLYHQGTVEAAPKPWLIPDQICPSRHTIWYSSSGNASSCCCSWLWDNRDTLELNLPQQAHDEHWLVSKWTQLCAQSNCVYLQGRIYFVLNVPALL